MGKIKHKSMPKRSKNISKRLPGISKTSKILKGMAQTMAHQFVEKSIKLKQT